jgi:sugar phosphate isomerase/epimerase
MQIAISTETLSRETPAALERAAALGFRTVEINLQNEEFGYGYRRRTNARFYRSLRKQIDDLGLRVWSVSSPPLTQEQMFFERARKDILMSGAIAAGTLGAQVYVVRPADLFVSEIGFESYMRERGAPPVIEGFDEAWVQAVNRRLTMAIQNRSHWVGALLTNEAERIQKVTDDLAVGWAMDVRSALSRGDMATWLERAGDRLAVAHVYDYLDERQCAPTEGDWATLLPALGKTRLKCCVIHAPDAGSDEEILRSRDYLLDIVKSVAG